MICFGLWPKFICTSFGFFYRSHELTPFLRCAQDSPSLLRNEGESSDIQSITGAVEKAEIH